MLNRYVLHVVYDHDSKQWKVKKEYSRQASKVDETQLQATKSARKLVSGKPLAQIKIHGKNGLIVNEWTYGKDPREYPG